jgi:branched-chain amino acid aminotransferase
MNVQELASVDGLITPTADAVIPLQDNGLYRGDGAFEVIKLYGGKPFAFDDHLDRMVRSAEAIHLEFDRAALEAEAMALLAEAGPIDAQLRLIATRGGRRIATIEPLAEYGPSITLATVTYRPTLILNGVKSLSYGANMQATRLAEQAGAEDAVLVTPEGIVLEPPTSSIFWVSATGVLRTTELEAGVLDSITRDRVMRDLEVETGAWPQQDLLSAREAFIVSTTREIQAVSRIDDTEFPDAPGPMTQRAKELFQARVAKELEAVTAPAEA